MVDLLQVIAISVIWDVLLTPLVLPLVMGMFRRLAISLFAHWRGNDPKRRRATMTDFHGAHGAEHARQAMRLVTSRSPSLKARS